MNMNILAPEMGWGDLRRGPPNTTFTIFSKAALTFLIELHSASEMAVGPIQPLIQWIPMGVKRPGNEADNSHLSSVEVKNGGVISPLLCMSSWRGAY
jgi:hypothetical protein